tara:strand:+ start:255 stop:743 length:489 start_codon:yes stop_codon:yes gene_type:complete
MKTYKQFVKELDEQYSDGDIDYITHWKDGLAYDHYGSAITKEEYLDNCDPVRIAKIEKKRQIQDAKDDRINKREKVIFGLVMGLLWLGMIIWSKGMILTFFLLMILLMLPIGVLWLVCERWDRTHCYKFFWIGCVIYGIAMNYIALEYGASFPNLEQWHRNL